MYKQMGNEGGHSFSISTVIPETNEVQMIWRQMKQIMRHPLKTAEDGKYYICEIQMQPFDDETIISPIETKTEDRKLIVKWNNIIANHGEKIVFFNNGNTIYYDDDLNISTIQFDNSKSLDGDKKIEVNLDERTYSVKRL